MRKKVTYEVKLRKRAIMQNVADEEIRKKVQNEADLYYWQNTVSCETSIVSIDEVDANSKKVVYDVLLIKKKILEAATEDEVKIDVQKDADLHYWQAVADCTTSVLEIEDLE
ncbi:MAG: hypothetical protein IJ601_04315 [Acidaminococcaceae bacterium]|nr:hypothetical protein [Acidaminococcaceae bacterium]